MLLALVISSTISAAPADELELPPWPPKLRAERRDGGVWLDGPTSMAVHLRLEFCDRLPELARRVGDARIELATTTLTERQAVDTAAAAVERDQLRRERWPPLQRVGVVLAAGVVGAAVGYLAAALVHR